MNVAQRRGLVSVTQTSVPSPIAYPVMRGFLFLRAPTNQGNVVMNTNAENQPRTVKESLVISRTTTCLVQKILSVLSPTFLKVVVVRSSQIADVN